MKTLGLIMGIFSVLGMLVGFAPCLGSFNWINIPFAVVGMLVCNVALIRRKEEESKTVAMTGMIFCIIAAFMGILRLILGGGVL